MQKIKSIDFANFFFKITIVYLYLTVALLLEEKNLDWFGYKEIFDNGAWLAEGKRDYGFLFINYLFKWIAGDKYILFRHLVNIVFSIFILTFLSNSFLKTRGKANILLCIIALIPFFFIRYTVQIREGLAASLILLSIGSIYKYDEKTIKNTKYAKIVLLLFIAASIHAGVAFFLIIFLFSTFITLLSKKSNVHIYLKYFIITTFYLLLILFLSQTLFQVKDIYYTGAINETRLSVGKIIYWLFWGIMIFWLKKQIFIIADENNLSDIPRTFFYHMFFIFLVSLYLIGLFFLFTQFSNSVLSGISRIMNMIICINIFILSKALLGYKRIFIFLISIFLFIDLLRILFAALSESNLF